MSCITMKKPRFLCLHGFRNNAEMLKKEVHRWPEQALEKLDLVFLDAPYIASGKSGCDGIFNPPLFEWFQIDETRTQYTNFEECVQYIEDFMVENGPFDGILGASQGAGLAAAFLGMQSSGVCFTRIPKIKCVILISGSKYGGGSFGCPMLAANAFISPIRCPSLHFIGETDWMRDDGIEALNAFVDPFVVYHSEGHVVPKLDDKQLETVLRFIERVQMVLEEAPENEKAGADAVSTSEGGSSTD